MIALVTKNSYTYTHIQRLGKLEDISVVEPNEKVFNDLTSRWALKCKYYKSIEELPYNKLFDIALVACPTEFHYSSLKILLEKQIVKAVICEKPCTNRLSSIEDITSISRSKQIPVFVNYQRRLEPF